MCFIASMHVWVIALWANDKNSRGLKFDGFSVRDLRTAAVNASRKSLSMFILHIFIFVA